MDWYKASIARIFAPVIPVIGSSTQASVLYQIKTAPTAPALLSVQSQNTRAIVADNICLAHIRIQASKFLVEHISPVLHRLESYRSKHRSYSQALHKRQIILRASSLGEAEKFDSLAEDAQDLIDDLNRFVGIHVQQVSAIRLALKANRFDDLAQAIVAACRQAEAFRRVVSSSSSVSQLHSLLAELALGSCARRDGSDHVAGQLNQFWNQVDTEKHIRGHDVRLTLDSVQQELGNLQHLRSCLEKLANRNLAPAWGFRRNPLRYSGVIGFAACASNFVATQARFFGGTGRLEDEVEAKLEALKLFANVNILRPSWQLYEQVFLASPVMATEESVAASKSAVRDMLVDFTRKHLPDVPEALELAENGSMKAMFDLIRVQAGTPIRSLLQGSLAQAMLIQIQKLKCDVEELMIKTKQTLRAQELNLALFALVPSLLTGTAVLYLLSTLSLHWRNRGRELIVSSGQTARFILADIYSSLISLEALKRNIRNENVDSLMKHAQHAGIIHLKTLHLQHIIRFGGIQAPGSVLRRFQGDLQLLQDPELTMTSKRLHIQRMLSCYKFLT